ncbi:MAG: BamA/TamA family outer membrane protein [bacterium]|nr:BamA/TamA family outer membrane protein [bacterium]
MRKVRKVRETRPTLESIDPPHKRRMQRRATGRALALAAALGGAIAGSAFGAESGAGADLSSEPFGYGYDPWQGMERNGRIPKAVLPDDLPNPEHWRYFPEGRIEPGSIFERLLVTSFIAPYVFHDSDIGTGGGIAMTDIDFRHQRRQEFIGGFASYSSEGQQNYAVVWERWMHHRNLPDGGVVIEDRSHFRARASYSKTLTRRFFGVGPSTRERDEASYTDALAWLEAGFEKALPKPGSDLLVGVTLRAELHELADGREGGTFDVDEIAPALFEDAEHDDLGRLFVTMRWDTRDSPVNPYRGWMIGGDIDSAPLQSGGETGALYRLYGTWVHAVPGLFHNGGDGDEENPPTDTFGIGAKVELTSGDLPFFALPVLGGGDDLRGYVRGRFRGGAAWVASAEYRFYFIARGFGLPFTRAIRVERVGAALFYDAGNVAADGNDLFEHKVRHSYGVGLRFMVERTAPFRVDVGFSEDGYEFTAGFGFTF